MKRIVAVASLALAVLAVVVAAEAGRAQPAAQDVRFYVTGFVKTPGSYQLRPEMTVQQGIALAGGLAERGSMRGIKIQRMVDGNRSEIDARLSDAVQPNDTIVVRQRLQ